MAGSYNKVLLMGNLTRDVELRHAAATNNAIAKFGLAVNRRYRTADGEQREEVTFVDCDAFGRTAELISQYFRKGRPIFIEGHLRLDSWEKDGQKFSKLKVVVDNFQFVDSREGGDRPPSQAGGTKPETVVRSGQPTTYEPVGEEEIPF